MSQHVKSSSVFFVDVSSHEGFHGPYDDLFLSECVSPLAGKFLIAASPFAARMIRNRLEIETKEILIPEPGMRFQRTRLIRLLLSLDCEPFNHVFLQSFEELSSLLFMLRHPSKKVHIIVTNNLKPGRLKRHPIFGRLLLIAVFKYAASIIVHCQNEVDRVRKLVPASSKGKIFTKPFHQFAFPRKQILWSEKSRTILFVGPERDHCRVEPVVDLIKNDKMLFYRYVLCGMKRNNTSGVIDFLESHCNVELIEGYVEKDKFYNLISDAALIILPHNRDFEGALSGIFCDAVASGTAVIARNMAPFNEFFERFGPMGFLVEYDEEGWFNKVLDAKLDDMYSIFQENMALCRKSCSVEAIRQVFRTILGRF